MRRATLPLRFLEGKGYRVLGAASGAEALRIAGEQNVKLNLLLTDVVMPGMNGKELAKRLAAQQPSLKILFVSGYPDNMIAPHGMLKPGVHFLQKPFKPTALLAKVREVLDQPRLSGPVAQTPKSNLLGEKPVNSTTNAHLTRIAALLE